jgi:hypothetical protein
MASNKQPAQSKPKETAKSKRVLGGITRRIGPTAPKRRNP